MIFSNLIDHIKVEQKQYILSYYNIIKYMMIKNLFTKYNGKIDVWYKNKLIFLFEWKFYNLISLEKKWCFV